MMRQKLNDVKALAFDADDTLWDCQSYFEKVEQDYCELLADYAKPREVSASLFETETANMPELGYGSKAFTLSLIENAVKISSGRVSGDTVKAILELGRSLLRLPSTPLEGVVGTLETLRRRGCYRMAVFTKGELLDQENKLQRSGLRRFFDVVSIVSDKTPDSYRRLCSELGVEPQELCMVGNSFKSDILPVLQLGGYAVHIPYPLMWAHEAADVVDHPHLVSIKAFKELNSLIGPFPKHPV